VIGKKYPDIINWENQSVALRFNSRKMGEISLLSGKSQFFEIFSNNFGKSEKILIFRNSLRKSEIFSDFFENYFPKSVGDISVTSEIDSESLTTLRKKYFKAWFVAEM
jgi:hypothetical protein